MARKSGHVLRRGVMRRETLWLFNSPANTAIAAAATGVLVATLNAAALALRPFTIVRVRGLLFASSDQLAIAENYSVSLGYAVVSDQAAAIGVTAVPTPEADRGSDLFFVYESIHGRFGFSTAAAWGDVGHTQVIDSKAMRKVSDSEDIAITLDTSAVSNGVSVTQSSRMLIKLH